MNAVFNDLMRYVDHMGSTQWIVVVFVVIFVGIVALRGFSPSGG